MGLVPILIRSSGTKIAYLHLEICYNKSYQIPYRYKTTTGIIINVIIRNLVMALLFYFLRGFSIYESIISYLECYRYVRYH